VSGDDSKEETMFWLGFTMGAVFGFAVAIMIAVAFNKRVRFGPAKIERIPRRVAKRILAGDIPLTAYIACVLAAGAAWCQFVVY
jgi:hypothetical protein